MASKFKRGGLHKLECPDCTGYAYATVANLETVGLPRCACGAEMQPERLELALMLGVDSPIVHEWQRRTDRKERAQQPARSRPCQMSENLASMAERAALEIVSEQRHEARQRRLSAIRIVNADVIPF